MKKYQLRVFYGNYAENYSVFAEKFDTQTSSSTSSGYYAFYCDNNLIACYPINRTIILTIEEMEENEL
jgi:hypothetical protein